MEHLTDMNILAQQTGIEDSQKLAILIEYAKLIYSENKKYNLTGHSTLDEIIGNLIAGSLEPVKHLIVPRGTLFADLGSGAGIPGIPLAIKYDESNGVLFDSNQKKIRFINKTASTLGINNVKGNDIRVEDAGRNNNYRECFDVVFTRAMSDIYTISELGAPLLKVGGFIFLYVNNNQIDFDDYLLEHLSDLGLTKEFISVDNKSGADIVVSEGLVLKKISETDDRFPRRMPVIKRMATR